MEKFLKKLIFFCFGLILLFLMSFILSSHNQRKTDLKENIENPLFIWGDSQIYRGLDLEVLKSETNRLIFSSAHHGSGVYDFIIFTEMVPESSDVLIAISKPVQVRSKKLDSNRSGISYSALRLLFKNNYSLQELLMIIRKNLFKTPNHIFHENNKNYDFKERVSINHEIFTIIEKGYDKFDPYIFDKQNLYIEGINLLKKKNCTINLIEFPFHQLLHDRIKDSPVSAKTDLFSKKIINIANCVSKDTLYLDNSKNPFFDLTHLNEYGANNVANFIEDRLEVDVSKAFTILNAIFD
jgi:hypothetical protein